MCLTMDQSTVDGSSFAIRKVTIQQNNFKRIITPFVSLSLSIRSFHCVYIVFYGFIGQWLVFYVFDDLVIYVRIQALEYANFVHCVNFLQSSTFSVDNTVWPEYLYFFTVIPSLPTPYSSFFHEEFRISVVEAKYELHVFAFNLDASYLCRCFFPL